MNVIWAQVQFLYNRPSNKRQSNQLEQGKISSRDMCLCFYSRNIELFLSFFLLNRNKIVQDFTDNSWLFHAPWHWFVALSVYWRCIGGAIGSLSLRFHGKQFGERKAQIWTNVFIVVDDCPSSGDNCENQFDNRDNRRLTAIYAKNIITPIRSPTSFFDFCQ